MSSYNSPAEPEVGGPDAGYESREEGAGGGERETKWKVCRSGMQDKAEWGGSLLALLVLAMSSRSQLSYLLR